MTSAITATDEEIQAARERHAECVFVLQSLATNSMHWSVRYAEEDLPPGNSLQEAAIEKAAGEADDARRSLLALGVDVPDQVGS